MDKIRRKISLEEIRNRFSSETYGEPCGDVVVTEPFKEGEEWTEDRLFMEVADRIPVTVYESVVAKEDNLVHFSDGTDRYYLRYFDEKGEPVFQPLPPERDECGNITGATSDDISGATVTYAIRYRNMLNLLNVIENFKLYSQAYRLCKRGDGFVFAKVKMPDVNSGDTTERIFLLDDFPLVSYECVAESGNTLVAEDEDGDEVDCDGETPYITNCAGEKIYLSLSSGESTEIRTNEAVLGDYVIVSDFSLDILKTFGVDEESTWMNMALKRMESFYAFASEIRDNGADSGVTEEGTIDIPLYLEEESDSLGLFTMTVERWIPNKIYTLGERVLDDADVVWRLVKGDDWKEQLVPDRISEYIRNSSGACSPYIIVDEFDDSTVEAILQDTEHIYVRFDENLGECYSAVAYLQSDTMTEENWAQEGEETETEITGITESKLRTLMRAKRYYDDDNEELPFFPIILTGSTDRVDYSKYENGEYKSDILYATGIPMNIVYAQISGEISGESIYYFDYILNIEFRIVDESGNTSGYTAYTKETVDKVVNEELMCDAIRFEYYCGNYITDIESGITENDLNGTRYLEEYEFSVKRDDFFIDESARTFVYFDIDYVNNTYLDNFEKGDKLYAFFTGKTVSNASTFNFVNEVKDEAFLGFYDAKINVSDLYIERGKSAAFERHMALGEISTFDDLETYKNGFFTLTNNENN